MVKGKRKIRYKWYAGFNNIRAAKKEKEKLEREGYKAYVRISYNKISNVRMFFVYKSVGKFN